MWILSLFLSLLLQAETAPPKVVVGLLTGQQVVIENPEFSGFIYGRGSDAVLAYRQQSIRGEMPTRSISRIDFGEYRRGQPIAVTVTLRNGQKLEVQAERQNFVTLRGQTDRGIVTIKHPDPLNTPVRLGEKKPDRSKDLTIQYLEFPAS